MRIFNSKVRFVTNIDSTLPGMLIGDDVRLRQILINVLGNAVKYTDQGFVSFSFTGKITGEDSIDLMIEVEDSGRGIKQGDIDNIFTKFMQFHTDTGQETEGIGLGLAISWNVLKAMGGDISVESEYGKGSKFTIRLPQKFREVDRLAEVKNPEKVRVLVYERRGLYADSMENALQNLNIDYQLVKSDEQFRSLIKSESFSHIFISHPLLNRNSDAITQAGRSSQVILLVEFAETVPIGDWGILSMPIHAVSVANVFSGVADRYSYNAGGEPVVEFTAPSAKILVVDDVAMNLKVAEGLMKPYKMKVEVCMSGIRAIDMIKANDYDIVFMDHKMPEMDGMETTHLIREMGSENPYYHKLPIVSLTANAVVGMREMFLQNGFNDFLSKPIDTVKLNAILKRWIPKEKQTEGTQGDGSLVDKTEKTGKKTGKGSLADTVVSGGLGELEIDGLDTVKGVRQSGGTMELYIDTLTAYMEDVNERIQKIQKSYDDGDLLLYSTFVHAIKGASANIGADTLSAAAQALEMAGQNSDMKFIKANHEAFMLGLDRLLDNIRKALTSYAPETDGELLSSDRLNEELIILKKALDEMNIELINATTDLLLKGTFANDIGSDMRTVSNHILMFEYDKATELIDSLIEKCMTEHEDHLKISCSHQGQTSKPMPE